MEHEPTRWPCPHCGETLPAFDHAAERTWRHLDTCQFQTHLHAEIPRVPCPTHGVKQVRVPWAEPRSRFTGLLERLIIDLILQCSTVKGACVIAGVSWDEAWGVMNRAVARGHARKEARPIRYIGVDEKAFCKGHRYHTIVCDLQRATVEFVAEDRKTESLAASRCPVDGRPAAGTARRRDGHVGGVHRRHAGRPARRRREDRLRSVPHHAGDDEGRRYGPQTGA